MGDRKQPLKEEPLGCDGKIPSSPQTGSWFPSSKVRGICNIPPIPKVQEVRTKKFAYWENGRVRAHLLNIISSHQSVWWHTEIVHGGYQSSVHIRITGDEFQNYRSANPKYFNLTGLQLGMGIGVF